MKTKKDIVKDWITRYSGRKINSFGKFILLTNFQRYVDEFAKITLKNVISCGVQDKVEIRTGDAKEILSGPDFKFNSVDLAFVDGNKEDYLTYVKIFEKLLSDDGLMIIDLSLIHI